MVGIQSRVACVLAAGLLVLLGACARNAAPAGAPAAGAPGQRQYLREGALELLVVAPEPGMRSDWIRAFVSDTGCRVRVQAAPDPAELLVLAAQTDADLVLAGGDLAATLVSAGRVQPLDPARIPALASLHPRVRAYAGATAGGRRYGLPWQWQANGLAYDTHAYPQPPSSWQALFEPAASADAAGRVLASAEPIALADAAAWLAATQPALRIADPYALDERQYAAALALLQRQRPALRGYARDTAALADGFGNGVTLAAATPAQVRALQARQLPVAWAAPADGGSARVDVAMLLTGARHPNCAYAWMQWSLSPAAQSLLAAAAGTLPVVPAACASGPLAAADACRRDGMERLPAARFARVPAARCGRARCVPYSRWTRDYLGLVGE